jgi:hypothetical protein
VARPAPANYTLKVHEANFAGAVDLSVGPLPGGLTATFTPPSPFVAGQGQLVGAGTSILTVNTTAAAPGIYTITINGKVGYFNGVTVYNLTLPVTTVQLIVI